MAGGLPSLSIVGLPETAVKEARDRVRCAIEHSGFEFPARRFTINLAPADLPKEGGRFDLPIALGVLAASGQIPRMTWPVTSWPGSSPSPAACAR
ncbi:MAG: magnesium chelatase domain-containing protein [Arhodomonas sp.]|nr:magnesium chelatase domain-containing protein [Arhodomonas sp.]